MLQSILDALKCLPKDYVVMIVAALPISELRGAIPLGLSFGMPLSKVVWLSILGNFSFVIPALFLFEPVTNYLSRFGLLKRFFDWQIARTRKKGDTVQKYEALGLILFVAIPLPMTGAWSGVIAASLFKIRFRYAVAAILTGILIAALIVSVLCTLGMMSFKAVSG